jgi:hypothetical protein
MIDAKKIKRNNTALANYFVEPVGKILNLDHNWVSKHINKKLSREDSNIAYELFRENYFIMQECGDPLTIIDKIGFFTIALCKKKIYST